MTGANSDESEAATVRSGGTSEPRAGGAARERSALLDRYAEIVSPDAAMRDAALERQRRLVKPAGALGRLEPLSAWLAAVTGQCPPPPLESVALVVFCGDHGVARTARTSAYPPEVTAQMVSTIAAGAAAANVLARQHGVLITVADLSVDSEPDPDDPTQRFRVRRGSRPFDVEDALTYDEAEQAFATGAALADEAIDSGAQLLIAGDLGIGNTAAAAALVGAITGRDASQVVGRGTGIDDRAWIRKTAAVRDGMRRAKAHRGDPLRLLATVAGADLTAMTGFLMQAAWRRTPVLLDGLITGACALVAAQVSRRSREWFVAGHQSAEPAHALILDRLRLEPILDLQMRLGEGTGALTALPVLRSAGLTLAQMATFEEADVSEADVSEAEVSEPTG